jgi:hypothetical protein
MKEKHTMGVGSMAHRVESTKVEAAGEGGREGKGRDK